MREAQIVILIDHCTAELVSSCSSLAIYNPILRETESKC